VKRKKMVKRKGKINRVWPKMAKIAKVNCGLYLQYKEEGHNKVVSF